jgi:hypothetical protein
LHLKLSKHSRSLTAANEFYSIFKWPNYGEAYKFATKKKHNKEIRLILNMLLISKLN